MPSAVIGPSKKGYVWVINDAEDTMYVPEGTIMGIDQGLGGGRGGTGNRGV